MKHRGKRLSKKTKGLLSTQLKESAKDQVVNSEKSILSTVDDNILNLPPPLTTTIDEIESGEDSINVNDDAAVAENVVSPNENTVTIPLFTSLPEYLRKEPISEKFVFDLCKFDYTTEIEKLKLNDKDYVKMLSWKEFNKSLSKLMSSYYSSLSLYYKYGLSARLQRDFCLVVAINLPLCEKKYRQVRKQSAKGRLSPDLSDTVKKQLSLCDLLFIRLNQNSRIQVKNAAKENGQLLKVKKNAKAVAESNRKRKTLRLETKLPDHSQ